MLHLFLMKSPSGLCLFITLGCTLFISIFRLNAQCPTGFIVDGQQYHFSESGDIFLRDNGKMVECFYKRSNNLSSAQNDVEISFRWHTGVGSYCEKDEYFKNSQGKVIIGITGKRAMFDYLALDNNYPPRQEIVSLAHRLYEQQDWVLADCPNASSEGDIEPSKAPVNPFFIPIKVPTPLVVNNQMYVRVLISEDENATKDDAQLVETYESVPSNKTIILWGNPKQKTLYQIRNSTSDDPVDLFIPITRTFFPSSFKKYELDNKFGSSNEINIGKIKEALFEKKRITGKYKWQLYNLIEGANDRYKIEIIYESEPQEITIDHVARIVKTNEESDIANSASGGVWLKKYKTKWQSEFVWRIENHNRNRIITNEPRALLNPGDEVWLGEDDIAVIYYLPTSTEVSFIGTSQYNFGVTVIDLDASKHVPQSESYPVVRVISLGAGVITDVSLALLAGYAGIAAAPPALAAALLYAGGLDMSITVLNMADITSFSILLPGTFVSNHIYDELKTWNTFNDHAIYNVKYIPHGTSIAFAPEEEQLDIFQLHGEAKFIDQQMNNISLSEGLGTNWKDGNFDTPRVFSTSNLPESIQKIIDWKANFDNSGSANSPSNPDQKPDPEKSSNTNSPDLVKVPEKPERTFIYGQSLLKSNNMTRKKLRGQEYVENIFRDNFHLLKNVTWRSDVPVNYTGIIYQDYQMGDGIVILDLNMNRPAYDAGIEKGDVIVEINGISIKSKNDFGEIVDKFNPGDKAQFSVLRNGKTKREEVQFSPYPLYFATKTNKPWPWNQSGMSIMDFGDGNGVYIVEIIEESQAAEAKLISGDLIHTINDYVIRSVEDIKQLEKLFREGDKLEIFVTRFGHNRKFKLKMGIIPHYMNSKYQIH